jgi:DNA invertase Pin-like site-specific DNA recombinase
MEADKISERAEQHHAVTESERGTVRAYPRVSTDAQDEERQRRSIEALVAREYPGWPVQWYVEHGVSAFSVPVTERPQSRRMLADLEQGDVIVVDDQDRLSRGDDVEQATLRLYIQERGAVIHTVTQGIVGEDVASRVVWSLKGILANLESETRGHRIRDGKAARALSGHPFNGDCPPGYRFNREVRALEPTDDLPVIAEIFRRFVGGASYATLRAYATERISEEALVRRRGHKREVRTDRIRGWLSHPIYVGRIAYKGDTFPGHHPPAVDEETWERAQARLAELRAHRKPYERQDVWALSGVAKHHCGRRLYRNFARNHGKLYLYAYCCDKDCQKRQGVSWNPVAVEANVLLPLAATALAVEEMLTSDPRFGAPADGREPTLAEAIEGRDDAQAELRRLGDLIADRALEASDPRYLEARAAHDAAVATVDRLTGAANSYRQDLAGFAASVLALADEAEHAADDDRPMAEETVTIIGDGTEQTLTVRRNGSPGPTILRVLRGWQKADNARRRALIDETLTEAILTSSTTELRFRVALPDSIVIPASVDVTGRARAASDLGADELGCSRRL